MKKEYKNFGSIKNNHYISKVIMREIKQMTMTPLQKLKETNFQTEDIYVIEHLLDQTKFRYSEEMTNELSEVWYIIGRVQQMIWETEQAESGLIGEHPEQDVFEDWTESDWQEEIMSCKIEIRDYKTKLETLVTKLLK